MNREERERLGKSLKPKKAVPGEWSPLTKESQLQIGRLVRCLSQPWAQGPITRISGSRYYWTDSEDIARCSWDLTWGESMQIRDP